MWYECVENVLKSNKQYYSMGINYHLLITVSHNSFEYMWRAQKYNFTLVIHSRNGIIMIKIKNVHNQNMV